MGVDPGTPVSSHQTRVNEQERKINVLLYTFLISLDPFHIGVMMGS